MLSCMDRTPPPPTRHPARRSRIAAAAASALATVAIAGHLAVAGTPTRAAAATSRSPAPRSGASASRASTSTSHESHPHPRPPRRRRRPRPRRRRRPRRPPRAVAAERRFRAMGSRAHVIVVGGPAGLADAAAARIERLEGLWSRFRPGSDTTRLNLAAAPASASPPRRWSSSSGRWRGGGAARAPSIRPCSGRSSGPATTARST